MNKFLAISQIVVSVILVGLILLQAQSGTGLGGSWSGGGETYHTRRGVEKIVFLCHDCFCSFIYSDLIAERC